jgi:hypothetical protein
MSFAKTKLSRALVENQEVEKVKNIKKKSNKRKAETKVANVKNAKVDEKNMQDLQIYTKRISGEGRHHVWIHMVGRGNVKMEYVMEKMDELQDILDNMEKVPMLQFTFVFDFRKLYDFADYSTLYKFGAFMKRNKNLFETRLRMSYLLLRYWTWRATVKTLFFAFPPTKEVEYQIPDEIDHALVSS